MSRLVIITGFMGSGKSAVSRELARLLGEEMIDLDQAIAVKEGLTPKEIIEQKGEAVFREVETRVLRSVLESGAGGVVALGGGAWNLQQNRELIGQHHATTVWLDTPFEICWRRILEGGGERPLAPDERQARILFAARRANYALSQVHIHISGDKSVAEIALDIVQALGN